LFENSHLNDKLIYQEEELKSTLEKKKCIVTGGKKTSLKEDRAKKQNILF
jgi:ATP-binding cassette subfamily C protein